MKSYKEKYIDKLNHAFGKKMQKLPAIHWQYSDINRLSIMECFGYHFLPDPLNTVVVTYKIQDTLKAKNECSYCIAYMQMREKKQALDEENPAVSPNFFMMGICPSGSIISKDGEYRSNIISWYWFNQCIQQDSKYKSFWQSIFKYLIQRLKERKYLLAVDYYFPNEHIKHNFFFEIELFASEQKVHFFAIAWFNYFFARVNGMHLSSSNKVFDSLLMQYKAEDEHFLQYLLKSANSKMIINYRYLHNNFVTQHSDINPMQKNKLGQKFYPLNLLEVQNPFNIAFRPWKELLISRKASNMVVNHVTPGFAISGSWMLISNSSERLFDNPDQAQKIINSSNAIRIIEVLKQAQVHTYHSMKGDSQITGPPSLMLSPSDRAEGKSTPWVSRDFKKIFEKIQDPIDFSKEFLIMSDVTLCLFSEYVGKTIYDALYVTQSSQYYKALLQPIFGEKGSKFFITFMFELCYNLFVLHSRVGVIHGDVHLSNITLNSIFYHNQSLSLESPKIAYQIDEFVYVFDHNYYNLCLIDFSRCILDNDRLSNFHDSHIPAIFPQVQNIRHLEESQIQNLHDYLMSSKPEYKEQSSYLMMFIKYNYGIAFKVLSILDLYNVSQKLIDFIVHNKDKNISAIPLTIAKKMFAFADTYLNKQMEYILNNKSFDELLKSEWPLNEVIQELFKDHVFKEDDAENIISVYQYTYPEKDNLLVESNFPDLLRISPNKYVFRDNKIWVDFKRKWDAKKKHRKKYEADLVDRFKDIEKIRISKT